MLQEKELEFKDLTDKVLFNKIQLTEKKKTCTHFISWEKKKKN